MNTFHHFFLLLSPRSQSLTSVRTSLSLVFVGPFRVMAKVVPHSLLNFKCLYVKCSWPYFQAIFQHVYCSFHEWQKYVSILAELSICISRPTHLQWEPYPQDFHLCSCPEHQHGKSTNGSYGSGLPCGYYWTVEGTWWLSCQVWTDDSFGAILFGMGVHIACKIYWPP